MPDSLPFPSLTLFLRRKKRGRRRGRRIPMPLSYRESCNGLTSCPLGAFSPPCLRDRLFYIPRPKKGGGVGVLLQYNVGCRSNSMWMGGKKTSWEKGGEHKPPRWRKNVPDFSETRSSSGCYFLLLPPFRRRRRGKSCLTFWCNAKRKSSFSVREKGERELLLLSSLLVLFPPPPPLRHHSQSSFLPSSRHSVSLAVHREVKKPI